MSDILQLDTSFTNFYKSDARGFKQCYEKWMPLTKNSVMTNDYILLEYFSSLNKKYEDSSLIYLESVKLENKQVIKCKVVAFGEDVTSLKKDDVVIVDKCSCFFSPELEDGLLLISSFKNVLCRSA